MTEIGNRDLLSVNDSQLSGPNAKVEAFTIQDGEDPDDYDKQFILSTSPRSYRMNNLMNGRDYYIRISSKSSEGFSDFRMANPAPLSPMDTPGAPTSVSLFSLNISMLRIVWESPVSNGGKNISRFKVQWSPDSDFDTILSHGSERIINVGNYESLDDTYCFDVPADDRSSSIGRYVRVLSFNGYAWNHPNDSPILFAVATNGPPGSVLDLNASPTGSLGISLTWKHPSATSSCLYGGDGGSPVTVFLIEWAFNEDFEQAESSSVPSSKSNFLIGGKDMITGSESSILEKGGIYFIRVSAMNSEGPGPATVFSSSSGQAIAVGPLSDSVPEPPVLDMFSQPLTGASLIVNWETPTSDGGRPLESYFVEYDTSRTFSNSKTLHIPVVSEKQVVEVESSEVNVKSQTVTAAVSVLNERQLVRTNAIGVDEIQSITTTCDDVVAEVQAISTTSIDNNEEVSISLIGDDIDEIQLVRVYGDDIAETQDVKVVVPRVNEIQLLGIVIENINTNGTISCSNMGVGERCNAIEESLSGKDID